MITIVFAANLQFYVNLGMTSCPNQTFFAAKKLLNVIIWTILDVK